MKKVIVLAAVALALVSCETSEKTFKVQKLTALSGNRFSAQTGVFFLDLDKNYAIGDTVRNANARGINYFVIKDIVK